MKSIFFSIFMSLISFLAISQPPPTRSSMDVLEGNKVKFSLNAPEARDVRFTGEWMQGYGAVSFENGVMKSTSDPGQPDSTRKG